MPDEALHWAAKATTEKERQSLVQLARIQVLLRGRQLASALGKTANCQTLVSLTLARGEVPVMLALRLFLPESWTSKRRSRSTAKSVCCRPRRSNPSS
jgi:SRSO17 transposase